MTSELKKNIKKLVQKIKNNSFSKRLLFRIQIEKEKLRERETLFRNRTRNAVKIEEPVVLISQIQRSGGTLLSQLFDAHPQCHAHPYELYIGFPEKTTWPVIDLNLNKELWFHILFEQPALSAFKEGYTKYGKGADDKFERFPFIFLPSLQKRIFFNYLSSKKIIKSQRDVFDCYMTSYFNAWIDNQNLYGHTKKWITAFVPRLAMNEKNLDNFFHVYPDGHLISIIREPKSWFVSAHKHDLEYKDIHHAIKLWMMSASSMVKSKTKYPGCVHIISFDDLLVNTEKTMRHLASLLDIDFNSSLLHPTFNSFPIRADSSFSVKQYGIYDEPLKRHRNLLTESQKKQIDDKSSEIYKHVLSFKECVFN